MAELRPKEMIFVNEYIRNGGNATQAAIAAGYSEKTAYSSGSRLLKSVEIQRHLNKTEQKLNRDLRDLFVEEATEAFETMRYLMKNSGMDNVRYSAAKDILDRAGYKPIEKMVADVNSEVTNHHEYHIEQTINTDPEAAELLKQLYKRQASTA